MSHPWNNDALLSAPAVHDAPGFDEPGVRAMFYDGVPYRGRPTQVFAWVGMPESRGGKVPGVVLVHGGGGTAFADWVRLWTARGYAAVAMDLNGRVPIKDRNIWQSQPHGGPAGIPASAPGEPTRNSFMEPAEPITDAWAYHAVSAVVLANSLLRAQPGVDADRIGLTGISWGGWTTCSVVGIDPRFACAAPVYGCGLIAEGSAWTETGDLIPQRDSLWLQRWDPGHYLLRANLPMLWVNGTNDFAYWPPAWTNSTRLPKGPRSLCMTLRMPHGHGGAGENPQEIHAFMNHHLKNGPAPARLIEHTLIGNTFTARFTPPGEGTIVRAELLFTRSADPSWPKREWLATAATIDPSGTLAAAIPDGATALILNAIDHAGRVASSEPVFR